MKFNVLESNFKKLWPKLWDSPTNHNFVEWLYTDLAIMSFFFLLVLGFLLYKGDWFRGIILVGFSVVIIFLFHTANKNGMTDFYAEAGYWPISYFIALPLILVICKNDRYWKYLYSSILALCLVKIAWVSSDYTERLDWVKQKTESIENTKVIINEKNLPSQLLKMNWGLPFESLIISSMNDKSKCKTIVTYKSKKQYAKYLDGSKFINGMGSTYKGNLNPQYFNLSNEQYRYIED